MTALVDGSSGDVLSPLYRSTRLLRRRCVVVAVVSSRFYDARGRMLLIESRLITATLPFLFLLMLIIDLLPP